MNAEFFKHRTVFNKIKTCLIITTQTTKNFFQKQLSYKCFGVWDIYKTPNYEVG